MEIPSIPIERAPPAMTLPSEQGLFLAKGSEALNPTIHTKRVDGQAVAPLGLFGFAFSCFVTGLTYMDIIPYGTVSISVYLLYGGLCQYIFGVIDWYRGNSLNSCLSILFALYNSCFLFFDSFNKLYIFINNSQLLHQLLFAVDHTHLSCFHYLYQRILTQTNKYKGNA